MDLDGLIQTKRAVMQDQAGGQFRPGGRAVQTKWAEE
jgi:hypothetical protein